MKIAVRVGKAAAVVAFAMPMVAMGQLAGVSHPDATPIMSTPDLPVTVPPAFVQPPAALPAPAAALKPRPEIPMETAAAVAPAAVRIAPIAPPPAVEDIDAGIVTRAPGPSNQLPVGTLVKVQLMQDVATESTTNGTPFTATLLENVERDGTVLLPAGSTLSGVVTDVHHGKRVSGPPALHLRTTAVLLPDGTQYPLHGQVIDTSLYKNVKVDREGTMLGKTHPGKVASVMALSAGSGMAAGAIVGGIPGAAIGAGVGLGVSTVIWLKQDRNEMLPVGTKISFALTDPLTVGVATAQPAAQE